MIGRISTSKSLIAIFFLACGVGLLAATLVIALAFAAPNPLSEAPSTEGFIRSFLPEGWGFFTKDMRESDFALWRKSGGTYEPASTAPESEARNLFGFKRSSRAEVHEVGLLVARVGGDLSSCDSVAWASCFKNSRKHSPVKVTNPSLAPIYCGRYILAAEPHVPYSWARFKLVTLHQEYADLEIACSRETR